MKAINLTQDQYLASQTQQNYSKFQQILALSINTSLTLGMIILLINETANTIHAQTVESSSFDSSILEQIDRYSMPENDAALGQVTNINQLKDVDPTDWSYEALRSLVDRYGCIAGFRDQTFRGDQPLTRYEFAAGLNACLNQIERLIASSQTVSAEDLAKLQRLNQEFEAELASLSKRLDEVKTRTGSLEDQQFSTTTKLTGESVFSIGHIFTGDNANEQEINSEPVFGNRSRLAFNTSFTGEDLLFTQLTSGNFPAFGETTGTFEGDLGLIADNDNNLDLLVAFYSFPLSDRTTVVLEGFGGISYDFTDTISPLDQFNDSASGSISAFGVRNPIYNQVSGSGIGIRSQLNDAFELSVGYLAPNAADPNQANGLFNGAYSALGQLVFKPSDRLKLGLTYVNAYNKSDTFTGSNLSNFNSFVQNTVGETVPISSNSYGVEVAFTLSDRFIISGWGGYTTNRVLESVTGDNGVSISRGDQDIWNWAVSLAFPDLLKEGNLGGIVVGMEPKVTDSNIDIAGIADNTNSDTSLHVEAFYQYQLTDNIAVTPGAVLITAPDHDSQNSDVVIGTLRTTFTF
ncbi:MAG: iron uptake porin [Waterburya sp.]